MLQAVIAQLHKSQRRSRLHRARGDSGQGESEWTNACIGEALADAGALKWEYHKPCEGMSKEQIENLTIDQYEEYETKCVEQNVWCVAQEVKEKVFMEPGPAGDLMLSHLTARSEYQFFHNAKYLKTWLNTASKAKQLALPGGHYFAKLEKYVSDHCEIGDLYMETLMGRCEEHTGELCPDCELNPWPRCQPGLRPYPDRSRLPEYHYLPANQTHHVS